MDRVVSVARAGDGSGRLFLAEQTGRIRVFDGSQVHPTPFLDLAGLVSCCGERGLLGLAFHPEYSTNGAFYVYYTNASGNIVLARYLVTGDPNVADPSSAAVVLTVPHPGQSNHNGGQLAFGPDGRLYMGTGDGGGGGDPDGNGQNLGVLLGKVLRLAVDGGAAYTVPADNPFVTTPGARPEIWARGLRNPWRFSFDRRTGDLLIADVGQSAREEIDFEPHGFAGGRNYGWDRMEGSLCYQPATNCNDGTLTLPVLEYSHSLGCSVTGGYRYRGQALPLLDGTYLFGDYCSGRIWGGVQGGGGTWTSSELLDTPYSISAFGEGENGELYVVGYGSPSTLYRITDPAAEGTAGLAVPPILAPMAGEEIGVSGVAFAWGAVTGADHYDLRVLRAGSGETVFSGSLLGNGSTSTLLTLPQGTYEGAVRACAGGTSNAQCGVFGRVAFSVSLVAPSGAPVVTFPTQGAALTASTQTLRWTAVTPNPALPGMTYEVLLRDLAAGTTALQITVPSPTTSTIFTMRSSSQYELKVRACQAGCGPWSTAVTFAVTLPAVPTGIPPGIVCNVSGGNSLTCSWGSVARADAYRVQVVQPPPAGPGGGALTVAARQVSATTVTLPVPAGGATVFISACNGDGCGGYGTAGITAGGPNPSQANIGTPMAGTVVSGPGVLFTWNRVPGDNGSNTWYRLFVQDLSRQATALDVFTTSNFYSAYFKAEGARYDALVVSNPGLASQVTGPAQGFNVSGSSATAPTLVSPAHNSTVGSGNIQLGWSPVPGATLYEYFVAVLGQGSATVRGVTPGLLAQVPLAGSGGGTVYSGIVRACPTGATCVSGSDAGWGPWTNAPGGPGVTNFTVTP